MSAYRWSSLHVVLARVTYLGEGRAATQHATAEPDSVSLHHILRYISGNSCGLSAGSFLILTKTIINSLLDTFHESFVKSIEKG